MLCNSVRTYSRITLNLVTRIQTRESHQKKKKKNFHGKLSVFSNQSFPSSGTSEITHFAKLAFVKGAGKVGMISTCLIF